MNVSITRVSAGLVDPVFRPVAMMRTTSEPAEGGTTCRLYS